MAELKPCPFCGGTDIRMITSVFDTDIFCAECHGSMTRASYYHKSCLAEAKESHEKEAIEAWNNRAENEELMFTRKFLHEHGLEFALASAWKGRKKDGK